MANLDPKLIFASLIVLVTGAIVGALVYKGALSPAYAIGYVTTLTAWLARSPLNTTAVPAPPILNKPADPSVDTSAPAVEVKK